MDSITLNELDRMPLNEVINEFFNTFANLCRSLEELGVSYHYFSNIQNYSRTLAEYPYFFEIDASYVKSRIVLAVLQEKIDYAFIKSLISDKYKTIKAKLAEWDRMYDGIRNYEFIIREEYRDKENATISKQVFLNHIRNMCGIERDAPPTIGYFYDAIVRELEEGYKKVMGLFPGGSIEPAPTLQPEIKRQQKPNKKNKNLVKPQKINIKALEDYFKAPFRGVGESKFNFFETMIDDINRERCAKEFGEISYMIYSSGQMSDRKPNTFAAWHRIFCENIGIQHHKSYKKSHYKNPSDNLKTLFSYLKR